MTVFAVLGTVLAGAWMQAASAASLTNPPTRLYMAPAGASLGPGFADVPIGDMPFTGTDPISNQARELTVNAEDGPLGCDPQSANDWFIDDCTRVQMDVSHGTISVGPLTTEMDSSNQPVYLHSGGAVVDQSANPPNGPTTLLHINGTQAQLQAALDDLVYTPDAGYWYTGSNPEELNIDVVSGDPLIANQSSDVQIRVLDGNTYPMVFGPASPQQADPEIEKVITGFTATDEDNDEDVDGFQADPPEPLPDPIDGANTDILLMATLDCGQTVDANEGFHLQGGTFQSGFATIEDQLNNKYDVANTPDNQPIVDAILAKMDVLDPNLRSRMLSSSSPTDYTTAWAGIGTMAEVLYALDEITFLQDDENDSCLLRAFVNDLGNNGLPTDYDGVPPTGVETPDVGAAFFAITVDVGPLDEITATFAGPITPEEGTSGDVTINITPAQHPAFDLLFSTVDGAPGATAGSDFQGTTDATISVPADATSVVYGTNIFDDADVEGQESFSYLLEPPADAPDGWKVTANSTTPVTIIDNDDADREITMVSDPSVTEGDVGTKPMTFTLTLDGAADGDESVMVSTADGSATVLDGDYLPVVAQNVTFAPNTTTATVNVTINGDMDVEADQSFTLALSGAQNVTIGDPSGTGTITNDDVPADPAPTVTINQDAGQSDPAAAGPIEFAVVFSETVTGFDGTDVDLSASTAPGTLVASVSGSGASYTVSVSGMTGNGDVVAAIPAASALDSANQPNAASTSTDDTVTYAPPADPAPTVTINQAGGQADPTSGSPIQFAVQFSEPVTGFAGADVDLSASTATGTLVANVSGAGANYTVSVSGMTGAGDVVAGIPAAAAVDSANQPNTASTSNDDTVTYVLPPDPVPTVTMDQAAAQADPADAGPILFDVVFSEAVTGFSGADVDLSASTATGTLVANVSGSGASYTVSVTGMTGAGDVVAAIPAGAAMDVANQGNTASTSNDNTVTYAPPVDLPPAVMINQAGAQSDPAAAGPIDFTVVFSENVTGFTGADVDLSASTATGPLAASVAGSGMNYTVTVSGMVGTGSVVASVPAGAAVDSANQPNTPSMSLDNSVAFTPPATHFQVVAPAAANVGSQFNVSVTALDAGNVTVTGYSGTVHLTSTDGAAVLPADATLTNGTGSFAVTLNTAGNQTVTATDTVTASIDGVSGTIDVSPLPPGPATHFMVTAPPTTTAGDAISVTVTALDAANATATGYAGTVHLTSSDGTATLPADATLTNGTGSFSVTLTQAGSQTVTATDTVTASITGTSGTIAVAPGAPAQFKVSPPPANPKVGVPFSLTITVVDQFGNIVTAYAGTLHFTSTDPNAVLPADANLVNGFGTFSVTYMTAGVHSVGVADTVNAALSGSSIATQVTPVDPDPTTTTTSTTSTTTPTSTTTEPTDGSTTTTGAVLAGDVNGDGVVDGLDAVAAPVNNGVATVYPPTYTATGALPSTGTDAGLLLLIGLVLVTGGLVLATHFGRKRA